MADTWPYPPSMAVAAEKAKRDAKKAKKARAAARKATAPVCRCRNHMGGPKAQHKSRDAALQWVLAHQHFGATLTVYACPSSDRFHVRTSSEASRIKRVPVDKH